MKTYDKLAVVLSDSFGLSNVAAFILAFFIIYAVIYVILKISKRLIEKRLARSKTLSEMNRTAGMFVGFIKGSLVALVVAVALILVPFGKDTKAMLENSTFITFAKIFEPYVMSLFGDKQLFEAASKINQNPQAAGVKMMESKELQQIASHPKLQEFAQDPEVKKLVEKQDVVGLMANKKFLDLMNDKEIMDIIRKVDIQKLLADINSSGSGPKLDMPGLPKAEQPSGASPSGE